MYPMPDKYLMLILDQRFTRIFWVWQQVSWKWCNIDLCYEFESWSAYVKQMKQVLCLRKLFVLAHSKNFKSSENRSSFAFTLISFAFSIPECLRARCSYHRRWWRCWPVLGIKLCTPQRTCCCLGHQQRWWEEKWRIKFTLGDSKACRFWPHLLRQTNRQWISFQLVM